jgi:hypothetical protein
MLPRSPHDAIMLGTLPSPRKTLRRRHLPEAVLVVLLVIAFAISWAAYI